MSKKIKGITIQLEGDASPLEKALKDVDKASSKTTGELNKINRALKFDEGNTVLLAQKQEVLQDAIQNTTKRLDSLKQAQSDVDRMFKAGEIDAKSYREFQREIEITEGKLKAFRNQAADVKAKITVQADLKGIDKIKSELKSLPDEAKRAGKEIGQNLSAGAAAGAAGMGALTVGMTDTNKQLSRFESQAKSAMSSANKLGNNVKKLSDEEVEALEKATEGKEDALEKSYDKQLAMAEKSYDEKESAFEKSLDNEMNALEKAHDKKIKLIDTEYKERLKLIDEEEYKRLKAIDAQIEGIEAEQDAIDRANKLEEENLKRAELQKKVDTAKTKKSRELAVKALAEFEAKIVEDQQREQRKEQIETLKEQKDAIKENADQQRDAIESEYDLKVQQINETFEAEKAKLSELHTLKREQFADQKSTYLANVKAQYDEELKLYKEMNAKRVEEAQKPVKTSSQQRDMPSTRVNLNVDDFKDSRVIFESVRQDVDQAVEAMGNLVRAGYETEKDITDISKNIAGAIQLYGDTFNAESLAESITTTTQLGEVTGQLMDLIEKNGMTVEDFNAQLQQYATVGERAQFISELLASQGMALVYDEFARANPEIVNASKANVEFTDALNKLTIALTPLITWLTKVITMFANWAAENPKFTKTLVIVGTAIAAIAAAVAVLGPIIAGAGAIAAAFGTTLGALLTPIGWVVAAIAGLIGLFGVLSTVWGKIKDLFSGKKGKNSGSIEIPEIPAFAKGTDYFRGGKALVGEEGPEILELPTGSKIHNNKDTMDMLGNGPVINVSQLVVREEADVEKIARKMFQMWQENQRGN